MIRPWSSARTTKTIVADLADHVAPLTEMVSCRCRPATRSVCPFHEDNEP